MSKIQDLRQGVVDYIHSRLGGDIVDIELDPKHYETSLDTAINVYKQRSQNAYEESYMFLTLETDVNEYILPDEVQTVRQIYRRTIGSTNQTDGGSSQFQSFEAGYLNTYLLTAGQTGGLLSYELYTGYQELAARMFGGFINFNWEPSQHKLTLSRKIKAAGEVVGLHVFNYKPASYILENPQTAQWIKDYALAVAKTIIGQAREKFASIAGPQGGTSLNGAQMKQEGTAEIAQLLEDLKNYVDGSQPLGLIIG